MKELLTQSLRLLIRIFLFFLPLLLLISLYRFLF